MNGLKTALLLGLLSGVLLVAGQYVGGRSGLTVALGLAVAINFASYFFSDRIALSMYSAQPVSESQNWEVYRRLTPLVENLCHRMGLPVPKLWVIPEESPNAFATGRNPRHASVAVTEGILRVLDDRELEGVLAHELGHVKNRDILTSSVAATVGAAIAYLLNFFSFFGMRRDDEDDGGGLRAILVLFGAMIAAGLIQMAISRTREYAADAASAEYTGGPWGLISALRKLEGWSKRVPMVAAPATAHMFIIKPFSGQSMMRWFSTHPATEERIARLERMAVPKPI